LSDAFRIVSPTVGYTAERARRKLLQMPLAAVRIGQASAGNSLTLLLEFCPHVSYTKVRLIMNAMNQGSRHEGR